MDDGVEVVSGRNGACGPRKRHRATTGSGGGGGGWFLLFFILGWVVYGGWKAGLKTALLSLPFGFAAGLSALIPVAGPFGYYFAATRWLMPLFPRFGLEHTWVTGLLFWGGLVASIIGNIVVTVAISIAVCCRRRRAKTAPEP